MVKRNMTTFPLSDVLHVTVTKQVQFINKPAEKAISETCVNFTLPHWISYVIVGRPRKQNAIREGIEDSFLYHGNSKVTKVLHRSDTNTYQVHLMTLLLKVHLRQTCVFTLLRMNMRSWKNSFLKLISFWIMLLLKPRKVFLQHTSGYWCSMRRPLWKCVPSITHIPVPLYFSHVIPQG